MISAQVWGNGFHLVAIIIPMLVTSIYLLKATTEARDKDTFQRWVIEPLFGLFAGWLTLAAFLNAGSAVRDKFGTTDDAQLRCRLKNRRGLLSKRKSTHLVWRCFSGREGAFRSS
jgi:hypothetical protein